MKGSLGPVGAGVSSLQSLGQPGGVVGQQPPTSQPIILAANHHSNSGGLPGISIAHSQQQNLNNNPSVVVSSSVTQPLQQHQEHPVTPKLAKSNVTGVITGKIDFSFDILKITRVVQG